MIRTPSTPTAQRSSPASAASTGKSGFGEPQPSTPQTGTWKHPKFDEIARRQNAATFTDQNMRRLLWNGAGFIVIWYLGRTLWGTFPGYFFGEGLFPTIASWSFRVMEFCLIFNIVVALRPFYAKRDDMEDIPLTPAQRKLLGLKPSSRPATPGSEYVTPPRYRRTSTPLSSSPANRRGSPASGSPSGKRSQSPHAQDGLESLAQLRMGASDSKLVFKKGIFRLSEDKVIPADDPYWASFWELPESTEDIFSLFSPADIRRTRDTALENLETLILAITSRLFVLRHHPSFPHPEFAPERDALNCIRILTRILPYIYEAEKLQSWEETFFWGSRRKRTRKAALARDVIFDESQEELQKLEAAAQEFEEIKPLAEELIDTLIDLLFFADFTLPKPQNSKNKVSYAIWQSGVGCNTPVGTSKEFENNRTEILRLLLTLTSQSMYMSANLLPVQGVKAITYIATCPDKQVVLSVLCSLLNTTLKYNPAKWQVPYNVQVFKDPKQILVTYALQPKLRKVGFGFFLLDASKQGVVRMCIFILQTLSVEPNFGKNLNKRFEAQDTLPPSIRLQSFNGTYADFLIHSIYNIITTSQGKLTAIYPALLAVINNIAAYLENISASTSSKLLQLFASMSSPGFLLSNESNHDLLQSLLESMNAIIEHQFPTLRHFTLESGQEEIERRNRRKKERLAESGDVDSRRGSADSIRSPSINHQRGPSALSNVPEEDTFAIGDDDDEDSDGEGRPTPAASTPTEHPSRASSISSSIDDTVPTQLRGMSEKARGKMPAGMPTFSRHNSTTSLSSYAVFSSSGAFEPTSQWIETWLPELPLHTILTLIDQIDQLLSNPNNPSDIPPSNVLRTIQKAEIRGIETTPIRIHSFEWTPLSLGWYESLLWAFVFTSEMQVAKGTIGVWNGTAIKLFRVQEVAAHGPTFSSPRGAVDAVGSNIVSRLGSMNLRGVAQGATTPSQQGGGGGVGGGIVRTGTGGSTRNESPLGGRSAII
ncbi:hypothetical protein SS1G_07647 [Sclerotinia sclerotiorum 1980 UF-70]|uniref:High-temperature-induced dauer-formation protein n=1 Tax=Sclerotinia sclerotiorum (strain ATCC 18683 / 1980 / Ss-1) TaxID=665079 RepID=A7EQP4_SCLS1|nr:hypothetical protein SS1G_07647 [Sclerotinia sclerotiorum 1980 UF-70]EDN91786.1 hypothetical protein SS1G_07647 [Sclerotinia sclerotiorum 1980 UF-70]